MADFVEAYRKLGDDDTSFDIEFWQAQGPEAIFAAAHQLILDAMAVKDGHVEEPRLLRRVEVYGRMPWAGSGE